MELLVAAGILFFCICVIDTQRKNDNGSSGPIAGSGHIGIQAPPPPMQPPPQYFQNLPRSEYGRQTRRKDFDVVPLTLVLLISLTVLVLMSGI